MKSVEKMTKKERKTFYKKYRNTWDFCPTTRREEKNKYKKKRQKEIEKSYDY